LYQEFRLSPGAFFEKPFQQELVQDDSQNTLVSIAAGVGLKRMIFTSSSPAILLD
jgi:hypothetical protein